MTVEVHIVRGRPTKETVLDQTYIALQFFNDEYGFDFAQTKENITDVGISIFFTTSQVPQMGTRLNFDLELNFATFTLASDDTIRLGLLRDTLNARIGFETPDNLLKQANQDMSPRALIQLGRGFSDPQDRRVVKLLRQALVADVPNVRGAAALAVLNLKWNVLLQDLQSALNNETDTEVRETMTFVLDRLSA